MRECLFFDAYISEGQASLQIVSLPLLDIPGAKFDVSALEGKPCWVAVEDNFVKFVDWWRKD